jgi:hypothetical protein
VRDFDDLVEAIRTDGVDDERLGAIARRYGMRVLGTRGRRLPAPSLGKSTSLMTD